jgi:alkylhydroperoxidase family enzyme
MATRTRVPQAEITGIMGSIVKVFSRRQFGQVPEAVGVLWNNQTVLKDMFKFAGNAEKWNKCEPQLKSFAHMAAASTVGCNFCLDLGYFKAHNESLDLNKAREVPRWRESDIFSPLERDVLEYAEAMSQTPPAVTDALSARLLDQLGAPALVELTAFIGAANMAGRNNVALGLEAQGFSASCGLAPLATPSTP